MQTWVSNSNFQIPLLNFDYQEKVFKLQKCFLYDKTLTIFAVILYHSLFLSLMFWELHIIYLGKHLNL